MTASFASPPYIEALAHRQHLTASPPHGLNTRAMPQTPDSPITKAEQAAAARKARRAAMEAEALRKNLLKRKAQSRERAACEESVQKCR